MKRFLIMFIAVSLMVSPTLSSAQTISGNQEGKEVSELNNYLFLLSEENMVSELEDVTKILTAIEKMPEEVIYSSDETKAHWMYEKTGINILNNKQETSFTTYASVGQIAACAGALGQVALLAFTPAKLLKVKAGLKAAGGAKTFVTKFHSAYKTFRYKEKKPHTTAIHQAAQRAAAKAAPEARAALADLFGVGIVVGACSWIFEK